MHSNPVKPSTVHALHTAGIGWSMTTAQQRYFADVKYRASFWEVGEARSTYTRLLRGIARYEDNICQHHNFEAVAQFYAHMIIDLLG